MVKQGGRFNPIMERASAPAKCQENVSAGSNTIAPRRSEPGAFQRDYLNMKAARLNGALL